jgi:hypothetical protein
VQVDLCFEPWFEHELHAKSLTFMAPKNREMKFDLRF